MGYNDIQYIHGFYENYNCDLFSPFSLLSFSASFRLPPNDDDDDDDDGDSFQVAGSQYDHPPPLHPRSKTNKPCIGIHTCACFYRKHVYRAT